MPRSIKRPFRAAGAVAALSMLVAGCSLFSSESSPTPSPSGSSSAGTSISTETATPSPSPSFVKSVNLVATIGEPKDWTPAGLTWKGLQTAAATIGAKASLVEPGSKEDLSTAVSQAASADGAVVVTVGQSADAAVREAAAAHSQTEFIEMDVVVPAGSPANVHGLVFDQAEAGYLAGYVAASFAGSGGIGMVGDTKTDPRSANYAAGFRSGASEANSAIVVSVAYAGSPDLPDKGRTTAAGLVKAGSTVILTMPSLAGIGAMRDACGHKAQLVAVGADAWQTVPDVQPCLIVSVVERYDAAVSAAVLAVNSRTALPTMTVDDVANGGIALSDFHSALPAGLQERLDAVLGALRNGPPRATTAPPAPEPSSPAPSGPSASPKPGT